MAGQEYTLKYTGTQIDERLDKAGNAVLFTAQNLTDAQKTQARGNIGAGMVNTVNGVAPDENGNVEVSGTGGSADAVLYTEQTLTPEQQAQARANIGAAAGTALEPETNDIPKVFFGGPLQQTKTEAVVPFRYISATQDISGYAEIKAQGNSSMNYPKKNQTVKMFKDADCTEKLKVNFKGWGKQNKHVYKANWIDLTHARNVVSARLWGDVVRSRPNYAELPELMQTSPNLGAVDGFPVKVYANGIYQGRYTLNIPKDKWMANMDDDLDTHCILCGENYVSGCFLAEANINGADWTDEVHDTVPASIKTRWNEVISFVMNSTDEEFRANLGNYFDIHSLLDYNLFGLTSGGLDAFGKNQIYMTYDGQKWFASMYDMDSTWGLYWTGKWFIPTDYSREQYEDKKNGPGNLLYRRLEQLFSVELQTRWRELKQGALSIENIINRFERFTDIAPAELVAEDYASTTGAGTFVDIPSQDTNNIQQIRAFALARQAWTDEYVDGLTEGKLLYALPAPATFDGVDDYIDTGVKLFEKDVDFTIYVKYISADGVSGTLTVLSCMKEASPYPGVSVRIPYKVTGTSSANAQYNSSTKIAVAVITHKAGENFVTVNGTATANINLTAFDQNVLLGCAEQADGTKFRHWPGTIYACEIHAREFSAEEIEAKLNANMVADVVWPETANQSMNSATGVVGTGNDYVSEPVAVPANAICVSFANINNATFSVMRVTEYDADMNFLTNHGGGIIRLHENTEYVRLSAYPNGNTDPANNTVLTFEVY